MKDLADHLFDIIENSVNARASKVIIKMENANDYFFCSITDNGTGISGQEVLDPFVTSRKTRRIGLGLPLLKKAVEDTGGYLKIWRIDGNGGTALEFKMNLNHIDAKPVGDLARTFSDIFLAWPEIILKLFVIKEGSEKLVLDFQELRDEIEQGLRDYTNIRKHLYEVSERELKI